MIIINSKIADIDISEYPIIKVYAKLDSPTVEEAEEFIENMLRVIREKKGPFVVILDAKNAKWVSREVRTIVGIGFQYLEREYPDRYKKIFRYFPSWKMRLLHALVVNFVKAEVPEEIFSNSEAAYKAAKEFILTDGFSK